jgi:hypothetical protein
VVFLKDLEHANEEQTERFARFCLSAGGKLLGCRERQKNLLGRRAYMGLLPNIRENYVIPIRRANLLQLVLCVILPGVAELGPKSI